MASLTAMFVLVGLLAVNLHEIDAGVRVARSPQFSQAQANAQASSGGFNSYPPRPFSGGLGGGGFGGGGLGGQGGGRYFGGGPQFSGRPQSGGGGGQFGRPGFGLNGGTGSVSFSKSFSISSGNGAQSSAGSSAGSRNFRK